MVESTQTKTRKTTASKSTKTASKTTKTTKPRATAAKAKGRKAAQKIGMMNVSEEQRIQMIREAAYFRAEQRGFNGGSPEQDWVEAEAEIDQIVSTAA